MRVNRCTVGADLHRLKAPGKIPGQQKVQDNVGRVVYRSIYTLKAEADERCVLIARRFTRASIPRKDNFILRLQTPELASPAQRDRSSSTRMRRASSASLRSEHRAQDQNHDLAIVVSWKARRALASSIAPQWVSYADWPAGAVVGCEMRSEKGETAKKFAFDLHANPGARAAGPGRETSTCVDVIRRLRSVVQVSAGNCWSSKRCPAPHLSRGAASICWLKARVSASRSSRSTEG